MKQSKTKIMTSLILSFVLCFALVGCGQQTTEVESKVATETVASETTSESSITESENIETTIETVTKTGDSVDVNIFMPVGTPAISAVKAIKESADVDGVNANFNVLNATDLLVSKIVSEEADIAIVPSNLAIKMYNKAGSYQYAGTTVWGTLYVVTTEDITSWSDLKGKEMTMIGRGLTPDVVIRHLLVANGLTPDEDVMFNYLEGASDLAPLFISGKSTLSIMPEPILTKVKTKKPEATVAFDIQSEWQKINGGSGGFPQAGIIVNKTFAKEHPEAVKQVIAALSQSVTWVNEHSDEAGSYYESLDLGLKAPIITKAIPNANLRFENDEASQDALKAYYQVLFDASPELIGGKLPDEGFYYQD